MIDINKYEDSIIKNLEEENMNKIISYLLENNSNYIDELLENYLDIFTIDYDVFIDKYKELNEKYNYNLINEIENDTNILEEFYY